MAFPSSLRLPPRTGRHHRLATQMSAQLQLFQQEVQILRPRKSSHRGSRVVVGFNQQAANVAYKKLTKGDVCGTVKILTSDASYVSTSESARKFLALKHPPLPFDRRPAPAPSVAHFNVNAFI